MTEAPKRLRFGFLPKVIIGVLFALVCFSACDITAVLPIPAATPTPCSRNCPPPARAGGQPYTVVSRDFSLIYFDPWSVQSVGGDSVTLVASTDFGDLTVIVASRDVALGTTSAELLSQIEQQTLDPSQYINIVDTGVIRGAEIGYVDGSGESFVAAYLQPQLNTPDFPVYLQLMASVRGTTGLTFVTISPLDPNSPSANLVPDAEYDHIVNSIQWL
ncbi:MAG: hypothetical protein ACLQUY_13965 [Ktedonobacterales bacterium]